MAGVARGGCIVQCGRRREQVAVGGIPENVICRFTWKNCYSMRTLLVTSVKVIFFEDGIKVCGVKYSTMQLTVIAFLSEIEKQEKNVGL